MRDSTPRPSATGCDFPLAEFEAAMQADPEILGLLYTGSLGRGLTDRYSDLDLDVWVSEQAFAVVESTIEEVLAGLGRIQFVYSRGPAFVTALVGPDWQRVDLHLHGPTDTKPFADYAHARIVKDVSGALGMLVESSSEEPVVTSLEESRAVIEESIDSLVYLSLHNARGACWSAAAEITGLLGTLYILLARTRGRNSHGFRYVPQLLSAEEQALLADAWPARVEGDEVRRAAAALWVWTRYVCSEVEQALGQSLAIEIDESGMWDAINRLYVTRRDVSREV